MPVKPPSQSPPRQPLHWETVQKKWLTTSGKWMPGTAWWWWRWWVSPAAMRGEGGGSQMLPYFSFVSDNNLLQKGMWPFLKDLPAMKHFTIFWSLLSLPVVIWIMFSSHTQTHEKNLHLSLCGHRLIKTQILKHLNRCWVYLLPALTELRASTYLPLADVRHLVKLIALWKYHAFPPKGRWHLQRQRKILQVLILARKAKSPNNWGISPYRNCKKLQKFVLHSGAVSSLPPHTLQSSFLPPLPSVIATLFIKNLHLIRWELFSAIFPNAKSHKSEP